MERPLSITVISIVLVVFILQAILTAHSIPKKVQFETYNWNMTSEEDLIAGPYQPIILKLSENIMAQTGISLESVVNSGGEVIFNFFYTGSSPISTGYSDLVEVIILTSERKIIEDYILEYRDEDFTLNTI